jgi:hypothetical protein
VKLPRWLLVLALTFGTAALAGGWFLDATNKLDNWPFLTNVASSVVGFGFGLPVAVLLIGRLAEREEVRRWGLLAGFHRLELDDICSNTPGAEAELDPADDEDPLAQWDTWSEEVYRRMDRAVEQLMSSPIGPELASFVAKLHAERKNSDVIQSQMASAGVDDANLLIQRILGGVDTQSVADAVAIVDKLHPRVVETPGYGHYQMVGGGYPMFARPRSRLPRRRGSRWERVLEKLD